MKTALPVHLHDRHHFLFTFVHVGVESTQKKRDDAKNGTTSENVVGYAWLPLMRSGRLCLEEDIVLSVASTLPEGYLSCESLGLGKGVSLFSCVSLETPEANQILMSLMIKIDNIDRFDG